MMKSARRSSDETGQPGDALRESETRFRAAFDRAPVGVCLVSPEGRFLRTNSAFSSMLGYSESELLSMTFLQVTHPEDRSASEAWVHRLATGQETAADLEKRYIHKAGHIVWGRVRSCLLRHDDGAPSYFVTHVQDITTAKQAEKALRQSRDEIRSLSRRLADVEEAERKRMARELHDQVGQTLSAIGVNLSYVDAKLPPGAPPELAARLEEALDLVEQTARSIRNVMSDLRPLVLDDYGLVPALEWFAEQFGRRAGIEVRVSSRGQEVRARPDVETALFRIAQEALVNVGKHAGASRSTIDVEAHRDRHRMTITDDGVGFDPEALSGEGRSRGLGMINMRERAAAVGGACRIDSEPGKGTRVIVEVKKAP